MGKARGKTGSGSCHCESAQHPPGRTPEISYGRAILQPTIYNLSTVARQGPEKQPEASGNIPRGLHGENHREADRQIHPKPAGDHREDAGKTFGNTAGKTLLRVASRPCEGKACAHIPICQRTSLSISSIHLSASHHAPPKHPRHPAHGAWVRRIRANGTGLRHCGPPLMGWGCVCIEPKHPVPPNAAGGKPLLVGLPPSTSATAPFGTKRRTPAPCSWGGRSSTSSQRHWQAALRPASRRCGRDRRSVPFQSRSRRPDPARG